METEGMEASTRERERWKVLQQVEGSCLKQVEAARPHDLARNAHFQDYIEDGQMRFDDKRGDGLVTKSNALELMRLAGRDV
jgi:hypothetical protein